MSLIGFVHPKNQLIHYERYVDSRQSLTISLAYNGDQRDYAPVKPPRTDHFSNARGALGYRYYVPGLGEELTFFGSIRAVVDYSTLQLRTDTRFTIPADSLRASGFSLAPELLFGGKATLFNRITVSGAIGLQYFIKLFSTNQLTRNQAYWDHEYWTNDNQDWQDKRNAVTDFRRGWYPSVQVTVGVVLGKHAVSLSVR